MFYYSCLNFPPFILLCRAHPFSHSQSPPCCPCPWVIQTCSWTNPFPFFPPLSPPPPLWSLSVCSLFPCLWSCFLRLFVLLMRVLCPEFFIYCLQVRTRASLTRQPSVTHSQQGAAAALNSEKTERAVSVERRARRHWKSSEVVKAVLCRRQALSGTGGDSSCRGQDHTECRPSLVPPLSALPAPAPSPSKAYHMNLFFKLNVLG